MRAVLYILSFLAVIAAGFWAYRENYATQAVLRETRQLQRDIAALRDALSIQRAEWAWLNRPERLRELVGLSFEMLPLMPMEPRQFGEVAALPYPAPASTETGPELNAPLGAMAGLGAVTATSAEGL